MEEEFKRLMAQIPTVYKRDNELRNAFLEAVFDNDKRGLTVYEFGRVHSKWRFNDKIEKK